MCVRRGVVYTRGWGSESSLYYQQKQQQQHNANVYIRIVLNWMNEWMTEQKHTWRRMELERNLWLLKHNNNKIDKRKVCVDKENFKHL